MGVSDAGPNSFPNRYLFFFQMDEKCDKQYSDYSRVSLLLLCIPLHPCVFVQILKDSVTVLFSKVKLARRWL